MKEPPDKEILPIKINVVDKEILPIKIKVIDKKRPVESDERIIVNPICQ